MNRHLVLGGPGAGKTERLLRVVEEALGRGVRPGRVAFVAFTNTAADEARDRAARKLGLAPKALPYFRTIHSLCYRALGLRRYNVIDRGDLRGLADQTDERLTGAIAGDWSGGEVGDRMLGLDHYARAVRQPLRAAWGEHGGWDWHRQLRFSEAYGALKRETGKLDFTDMLGRYVAEGAPALVELAVVDEGQDLTPLQWAVVERAFAGAQELWVGGDDDQAIHRWAGADVARFLALGARAETEVLPVSHRLPRAVFDIGERIVGRISRRYAKQRGATGRVGNVAWYRGIGEVNLGPGTWLLLARTTYQLDALVQLARWTGVPYMVQGRPAVNRQDIQIIQGYEALRAGRAIPGGLAELVASAMLVAAPGVGDSENDREWTAVELGLDCRAIWHDALVGMDLDDREFYLACRRRGESLTAAPRVRISTVHGAKGRQADHVLLLTDLTPLTHAGFLKEPDDEHRVFYVGATRALESLHLVAPQTAYEYPI